MAEDSYFNHRVRLVSVLDERTRVEFKVTPTFTEGRTVDYTAISPIHMPGSIQVYKNTASRVFQIGAMLVSRSPNEAHDNMTTLQTLRTWTLPYFGAGSSTLTKANLDARERERQRAQKRLDPSSNNPSQNDLFPGEQEAADRVNQGVQLLGAPPMVLYLYAYSTSQNDARGATNTLRVNINRVPVVITNLGITYPNDVDYFPASQTGVDGINTETESFPTKMEVTIDCVETHSPREYERFSLADFHNGKLVSF